MPSRHRKTALQAAAFLALAATLLLTVMGQPIFCKCGVPNPWTSDAWSFHTSQHLLDPYSFTHFSHGLIFFWGLYFFREKLSANTRFLMALGIETCWELFENSPWVIEHYRTNTASLEYYGDSVTNSLGDLLSCGLGFIAAANIPLWGSLAIFAVFEAGLLLTIRDNLTLNFINLTGDHPNIVEWQSEAQR